MTQEAPISKDLLPELTPKQDGALKEYVLHGNKTEAYKKFYDCTKMKPETINRSAVELFDNPKITAWLKYYQQRQEDEFDLSLAKRKKMLATGAALGLKMKKDAQGNDVPTSIGGMKDCIAELNRMDGQYAPTKHQITGDNGEPLMPSQELSEEDLKNELEKRNLPTDVFDKS